MRTVVDYYLFKADFTSVNPVGLLDGAAWRTGKQLTKKPTLPAFKRTRVSPVNLPDLMEVEFGVFLFSPKAVAVMDGLGVKNIEYVPVRILPKRGREAITTFVMVNIIGSVSCLDREHADLTTFHGTQKVSSLYRYQLLESKLSAKTPLVFRLGDFSYHALAHPSVKAAMDAAKLKGLRMTTTREHNGV